MLMSETGRLVLSYLLELDYRETREKFMSECPAIAELRSLGPKELSRACRVNNRTLTDLLKEYIRYCQNIKIISVRLDKSIILFQFGNSNQEVGGGNFNRR